MLITYQTKAFSLNPHYYKHFRTNSHIAQAVRTFWKQVFDIVASVVKGWLPLSLNSKTFLSFFFIKLLFGRILDNTGWNIDIQINFLWVNYSFICGPLCDWYLRVLGWRTETCPEGLMDSAGRWRGRWASASGLHWRSPGPCAAERGERWGPHCWLQVHKDTQAS